MGEANDREKAQSGWQTDYDNAEWLFGSCGL